MKQVICMKWGTLYGPEYVNILYAMVRKNLTAPFRFVCLTDDATGLNPAIETFPCPTVPLPAPHHNRGWRKVSLFAPAAKLFNLKGNWLYLDLDVVVSGSLDDFFTFAREKNFVVMQNWTQPGKGIGNTSVYRFRVGADVYLLSDLVSRPREILSTYRNSQTYLSKNVREITFWPDQWCVLFKTHCLPGWPQRLWRPPVRPPKARVVAFPGLPNPPQAARGEWPTPPWKRLYKTLRPAPWIEELWRDDL